MCGVGLVRSLSSIMRASMRYFYRLNDVLLGRPSRP